MTKSWLRYFNLSDPYERKARFIPAVLSVLPLFPIAGAFGISFLGPLNFLLAGVGLAAVLAVLASHIASAFGNRLQERMWPDWPHDSPTNRFLQPDDESISKQQKLRWYQAIKELLNLDIAQAVEEGDNNEVRAVINDAVRELRNRLWKSPVGERVNLHNNDYGFARNFTGFRCVWLSLALVSLVGCWVKYGWHGGSIFWAIVSTAIAIGTLVLAYILPNYVRQKANHYAESFFAAVVKLRDME